ncbi:glycosyltransferase involved in cell wall biosynthesis [Arthrobacter sp. B2I5]|uniref:glycosyltransferase family 4 protein n=1 Tax=Arthrobacter sp. B2I5 TaxID=3042266 RepID=UPI00278138E0|nr:glycosyltransferase family 4 protein [Arthrobacter sp. B2I5]MDQ0824599.1 glycosyltransferase involved in cell wall biosynthesis [Arthrobacter sp. B2I5]
MKKVVIAQEYVAQYRAPFFSQLREKAEEQGIRLEVAYGEVGIRQASRRDAVHLDFGTPVMQREWNVAGRRIVVRSLAEVTCGADLVILEQARRNVDAYGFLFTKRRDGPVVALWGHGRDYTRHNSLVERWLVRKLTLKADWFFSYTAGGERAVKEYGYPSERITVVQNSIDTASLRESVRNADPESTARFISDKDLRGKTAIFVGALDPSKRLPFLVEASEMAYSKDSEFRLVIAGEGPMRSQVEEWERKYSWLSYLGPLSGSAKGVALASSQVLAMPGRVGLVAVDSFAAATPIITTEWAWHAPEYEYLVDGSNAIVSANDSHAYAEAVISVLNNAESLAELTDCSRKAADIFTVEAMVDNFLSGIKGALMLRKR